MQSFSLLLRRVRNILRGLVQRHAHVSVRRSLWDSEFSKGRWTGLEDTRGDCIYPYLVKYAAGGRILDLGCGSGNTGNELDDAGYCQYVGVDISVNAIEKARRRSGETGRVAKNQYISSDILTFSTDQLFEVILFRDSLYYVPLSRIRPLLERYSRNLSRSGVFVVRIAFGDQAYQSVSKAIEQDFHIVEKVIFDRPSALILVFRRGTR
jgi:SAM-dependent methyltransferase